MASMSEMVALQDQIAAQGSLIQELQSQLEHQREMLSAVRQEQSRPVPNVAGGVGGDESEKIVALVNEVRADVEALAGRLAKAEVAAFKGRPGKKPKHVQEALDAEDAA